MKVRTELCPLLCGDQLSHMEHEGRVPLVTDIQVGSAVRTGTLWLEGLEGCTIGRWWVMWMPPFVEIMASTSTV